MAGRKNGAGKNGVGKVGVGKKPNSGRSGAGTKKGRQGVQQLVVTLRRQRNPPNVREAVLATRLNQSNNQLRIAKNALVAVVSGKGAGAANTSNRGPQPPPTTAPFAVAGSVKEARGIASQRLEAANQKLASATQRLENVARQLNSVMQVEIMLRQALTNLRIRMNALTAKNNMRLAAAMRAGDAAGAAAIRAEHAAATQIVFNDGVQQKGRLRELLAKKIDLQGMYRQSTDEFDDAQTEAEGAEGALAEQQSSRQPRMKKLTSRRGRKRPAQGTLRRGKRGTRGTRLLRRKT